jgi:hypothetical protein
MFPAGAVTLAALRIWKEPIGWRFSSFQVRQEA